MTQIPPMPDEQYMGFFLGELKDDIHMEVLAFEPLNRHKLISVVRLIEQKLGRALSTRGNSGWHNTS